MMRLKMCDEKVFSSSFLFCRKLVCMGCDASRFLNVYDDGFLFFKLNKWKKIKY